jgi:hypothetical protein
VFDAALETVADPACCFWVEMTPRTFLELVPPLDMHDNWEHIDELADMGHVFAPPRLDIDPDPDFGLDSYPAVTGHDGRHRMTSLLAVDLGDTPLPVLVATGSIPCAWLHEEDIVRFRTAVWSQPGEAVDPILVKGPLFGVALVNGHRHEAGRLDELHAFLPGR